MNEKDKTVTVTLDLNEVKMLYYWRYMCEKQLEKIGFCVNAAFRIFGYEKKDICASLAEFIIKVLTKLDKENIEFLKKESEKKKEERMYIS